MFATSGYFRGFTCPYYASGLCERSYCHFRHVRTEENLACPARPRDYPQVPDNPRVGVKDATQKNKPSLLNYVGGAIKQMQRDIERDKMRLHRARLKPQGKHVQWPLHRPRPEASAAYTPTPISASYKPTPIHMLKNASRKPKSSDMEYDPVSNYLTNGPVPASTNAPSGRVTLSDVGKSVTRSEKNGSERNQDIRPKLHSQISSTSELEAQFSDDDADDADENVYVEPVKENGSPNKDITATGSISATKAQPVFVSDDSNDEQNSKCTAPSTEKEKEVKTSSDEQKNVADSVNKDQSHDNRLSPKKKQINEMVKNTANIFDKFKEQFKQVLVDSVQSVDNSTSVSNLDKPQSDHSPERNRKISTEREDTDCDESDRSSDRKSDIQPTKMEKTSPVKDSEKENKKSHHHSSSSKHSRRHSSDSTKSQNDKYRVLNSSSSSKSRHSSSKSHSHSKSSSTHSSRSEKDKTDHQHSSKSDHDKDNSNSHTSKLDKSRHNSHSSKSDSQHLSSHSHQRRTSETETRNTSIDCSVGKSNEAHHNETESKSRSHSGSSSGRQNSHASKSEIKSHHNSHSSRNENKNRHNSLSSKSESKAHHSSLSSKSESKAHHNSLSSKSESKSSHNTLSSKSENKSSHNSHSSKIESKTRHNSQSSKSESKSRHNSQSSKSESKSRHNSQSSERDVKSRNSKDDAVSGPSSRSESEKHRSRHSSSHKNKHSNTHHSAKTSTVESHGNKSRTISNSSHNSKDIQTSKYSSTHKRKLIAEDEENNQSSPKKLKAAMTEVPSLNRSLSHAALFGEESDDENLSASDQKKSSRLNDSDAESDVLSLSSCADSVVLLDDLESTNQRVDRDNEAVSLFNNHNKKDKHNKVFNQKNDLKTREEKGKHKIAEVVTGKKRLAHSSSSDQPSGNMLSPPKRSSLPSPAEVMHNRYVELQKKFRALEQQKLEKQQRKEKERKLAAASLQTAASKRAAAPMLPDMWTTQKNMLNLSQKSYDKKSRTAHVPKPLVTSDKKALVKKKKKKVEASATTTKVRKAHVPKQVVVPRPIIPAEFGSKVPSNIRQRYLNLIIDECLKLNPEKEAAFDRGLTEEKAVYQRASSRNIYLNLAVNTIKNLRNECKQGEVQNHRATKSLKNPLVLSHQAMLGGAKAAHTSYSIHRPVSMTSKLEDIKGAGLYKKLIPYILTPEQLIENGFPVASTDCPGVAVLKSPTYKKNAGSNEKVCCRCGKPFTVDSDGVYARPEKCIYHYGKAWKTKVTGALDSRYTCCQGEVGSPGCQVGKLHVHEENKQENKTGYVTTKSHSPLPDGGHGVYAMDCEMVYTTHGSELARVTVVDSDLEPVFEKLVRPDNAVIDFNTRFSGLNEEDMDGVTTTLRDVQAMLLSMFSNKTILIGHSLESDLVVLKIIHSTVVDTSVVFPHRLGPPYKRALRTLSGEYLKKIIQNDVGGHDSLEDAAACMDLMIWKVKDDMKKGGYR